MMYEILDAKIPVRIAPAAINLTLTLKVPFGAVDVEFTATPNDPESHGRELYEKAINGDFGPVGEI